jgi:hypothetical protein
LSIPARTLGAINVLSVVPLRGKIANKNMTIYYSIPPMGYVATIPSHPHPWTMCSDTLQIPRLHLCVVSGVCGGGQAGGRAGEAGRGPVRPRVPGCLVPAPIFSAGCLTPINGAITSAKWDLACCGVCMFGWLLELDR